MYILTAAQSYQAGLETSRLGHGYLTYALVVEGLSNTAADGAPKDGAVFVREWLDYATARVPRMQLETLKQERNLGEVQRPRVFYRRELETKPLLVAKAQTALPKK